VVALASLAIPVAVAGLAARGVVERPGVVMLAILGGSIVVTWLLAVHWTKHPISRDALFIDGLRKVHLALNTVGCGSDAERTCSIRSAGRRRRSAAESVCRRARLRPMAASRAFAGLLVRAPRGA
jgi:hypothetical protein